MASHQVWSITFLVLKLLEKTAPPYHVPDTPDHSQGIAIIAVLLIVLVTALLLPSSKKRKISKVCIDNIEWQWFCDPFCLFLDWLNVFIIEYVTIFARPQNPSSPPHQQSASSSSTSALTSKQPSRPQVLHPLQVYPLLQYCILFLFFTIDCERQRSTTSQNSPTMDEIKKRKLLR